MCKSKNFGFYSVLNERVLVVWLEKNYPSYQETKAGEKVLLKKIVRKQGRRPPKSKK